MKIQATRGIPRQSANYFMPRHRKCSSQHNQSDIHAALDEKVWCYPFPVFQLAVFSMTHIIVILTNQSELKNSSLRSVLHSYGKKRFTLFTHFPLQFQIDVYSKLNNYFFKVS